MTQSKYTEAEIQSLYWVTEILYEFAEVCLLLSVPLTRSDSENFSLLTQVFHVIVNSERGFDRSYKYRI